VNEWEYQLLEDKASIEQLDASAARLKVGDRVRLRPRKGGDVMDIALAGQTAIIESIEQDYENKIHVCVVLDDDPGRDMGLLRQPGHRFFFDAEEVELLPASEARPRAVTQAARILVAGIGNIFLGDDGFGVEVIRRLGSHSFPEDVHVADFGIRGFDLAYALQDGYETVILVDAYPHGQAPGTVSLVEPDLSNLDAGPQSAVETHGMNPLNVLRMASAMNGSLGKILLVGCEPATFGPEEGQLGLSDQVDAAVDEAVSMVVSSVEKLVRERNQSNQHLEEQGDARERKQ
jgi:hydrogenase maturation protease